MMSDESPANRIRRLHREIIDDIASLSGLAASDKLRLLQKSTELAHAQAVSVPAAGLLRSDEDGESEAQPSAAPPSSITSKTATSCIGAAARATFTPIVDRALYRAITRPIVVSSPKVDDALDSTVSAAAPNGASSSAASLLGGDNASPHGSMRRRASIAASSRDLLRYHSDLARTMMAKEREDAQKAKAEAEAARKLAVAQHQALLHGILQFTFPHDGDVLDSASTLFHRLFETLYRGSGTTVATLLSMNAHARQGMIEEGRHLNFSALANALHANLPKIIFVKEVTIDAASWRALAESRRAKINEFHHPVLVRTKPRLLVERLDFAVHREPGLIAFVTDVVGNGKSVTFASHASSSSGCGKPPSLVHTLNSPLMHFSTASNGADETSPWVVLDLRPWVFCVSAYSLCSVHPVHAGCAPRNWVFEGSFDGETWVTLSEHVNDDSIDGTTNFACWDVDVSAYELAKRRARARSLSFASGGAVLPDMAQTSSADSTADAPRAIAPPCSLFRVRGTGKNVLGTRELQVSAIELYGRVLCFQDGELMEADAKYFGDSQPAARTRRPAGFALPSPLPPPPAPKKGKKKK